MIEKNPFVRAHQKTGQKKFHPTQTQHAWQLLKYDRRLLASVAGCDIYVNNMCVVECFRA
jgi:hypothetical protein